MTTGDHGAQAAESTENEARGVGTTVRESVRESLQPVSARVMCLIVYVESKVYDVFDKVLQLGVIVLINESTKEPLAR